MTTENSLIILILVIAFPVLYIIPGYSLFFRTFEKYLRKHDKENYRKGKGQGWKFFYLNKIGILPIELLLPYWGYTFGLLSSIIFISLGLITGWFIFRLLVGISYGIFLFSFFYRIKKKGKKKSMRKDI